MKTITEFNAATLTKITQTQKDLTAAGKTPEELPAATIEALKISEDKLKHALAANEAVGEKLRDFKRVVVLSLAEGETAPTGALTKDGHAYVTEYYGPMSTKSAAKPEEKRGDRRGGRGDRKGPPRGKRPEREARGSGDPTSAVDASAAPRAPGQPPKVIKKPTASTTA